jgi:ketosteroid isomerase-like protein
MPHDPLIERYFQAADAHDIAAILACFTPDATVHDEGQEHHGTEAIHHWLETVIARYQPRYEALEISGSDEQTVATASVSGTFPGSPLRLTSRFTLRNGRIAVLKCGG